MINIRLGNDLSFRHEICQIKQKINDIQLMMAIHIRQRELREYFYSLFYRRIKFNKK